MVTVGVVDVGSSDAVWQAGVAILKESGHVDVLINNAGVVSGRSFVNGDLTPAQAERTLRINSLAHFNTWSVFLPRMMQRRTGYIVTVASVMGMAMSAGLTDYCASKWASLGAHHSLRIELRAKGRLDKDIKTLAVCPFAIGTGMFDGLFEGNADTWIRRLFFPILEEGWVAGRIVEGIERGERYLVMPKILRFLPLCLALPIGVCDFICSLVGGTTGMLNFKGRSHGSSK